MRTSLIMAAIAAVALAATAQAAPKHEPKPAPPQAFSAERAGKPASYRERPGHGYTAEQRRKLDCLASDRRYDPAADRIRLRSGATRACDL